jgi:hypothetical protein
MFLSKLTMNNLKTFLNNSGIISEDACYEKCFRDVISEQIYNKHISNNYISCAFCYHLTRTSFGSCSYTCSMLTYTDVSSLLPGIYTYYDKCLDSYQEYFSPWLYRTPCINFKRLDKYNYYRNFLSLRSSITIKNYEILEGLFTGISNGKRPCHLCASVDVHTYNRCLDDEKTSDTKPCSRIISEIFAKYSNTTPVKVKNAG